ncbi:MAG: hypothetical protein ABI618_16550 [Nitrospirota bacterium]
MEVLVILLIGLAVAAAAGWMRSSKRQGGRPSQSAKTPEGDAYQQSISPKIKG